MGPPAVPGDYSGEFRSVYFFPGGRTMLNDNKVYAVRSEAEPPHKLIIVMSRKK